ncbi:MAG: hypothetical protein ACREQM_14700, partial [Candidatus Dormibacteraceae bacterium]
PTWPSYISELEAGPSQKTLDLGLDGWAPPYLEASFALLPYDSPFTPVGDDGTFWTVSPTEALIAAAEQTTNKATAQKDYCEAEKQTWAAAPAIFLYQSYNPILTSANVKNLYGLPSEQVVTAFAEPASS